jgi:hypothetical protein
VGIGLNNAVDTYEFLVRRLPTRSNFRTNFHKDCERNFASVAPLRLRGAAHCGSSREEATMAEQKHSGNPGNFAEDREKASSAGQKGGENSSGNFAHDRERAAEAGSKGGKASSGGTHEQHVKAGQQSHKNS